MIRTVFVLPLIALNVEKRGKAKGFQLSLAWLCFIITFCVTWSRGEA